MSKVKSQELAAIYKTDLGAFFEKATPILMPGVEYFDNWHIHHLTYHLMRVRNGKCKRLIVNIPPRMSKSLLISVAFPCFLQVDNPSTKIMSITYSGQLSSMLHNLARKLLKAKWVAALNPALRVAANKKTSDPLKDTENLIETTKGGSRYSTTLGSGMTGLGADIIIVDDPNNTTEVESEASRKTVNDTFDKTIATRLNGKHGAIIVIQQRTHINDLTGHLMEKGGWTVVTIPAIAEADAIYAIGPGNKFKRPRGDIIDPRRFDQKWLDNTKKTMGSARFEAQYQQNPLPPEGQIIKFSWLKIVEDVPEFQYVVISADIAGTADDGDYTAFLVWGYRDGVWYLTDVYRERLDAVELHKFYMTIDKKHEPDCTVVERNGLGASFIHWLHKFGFKHVIGATVSGDKATRCEAVAPFLEQGKVAIYKPMKLYEALMGELLMFPSSPHDDMVDAFVLLLTYPLDTLRRARRFRRPKRTHLLDAHEIEDRSFVVYRSSGNRWRDRVGPGIW